MNIYTTTVLNKVVEGLKLPSSFILDAFFPEEQRHETEEIHFDIDDDKPRIAPFVSPLVEGKVVQSKGFTTKVFQPAYIKDKRVHRPDRAFKRVIGEQIGGALSPQQRQQINLRRDLEDQISMIQRRLAVMGSEALRTGKVTVEGEKYEKVIVDFGRDNDLTVALTTTARWGESNVSPVANLETWIDTIQAKSGATPNVILLDPKAWALLKADTLFEKAFDTRRGSTSTGETALIVTDRRTRARYVANYGDMQLWVYNERYIDPADGVEKGVLPDYTVIIADTIAMEGARAFGAIMDNDALAAVPFYSKSWTVEDPSVRYLLMQSAPLVVPYRVNATFAATVR